MKVNIRHHLALLVLGAALLADPTALTANGPQSIGTAGAFMVTARGIDAIGLNPANLGYDADFKWLPRANDPLDRDLQGRRETASSISFLGLNAQLQNNAVSPYWINNTLFGGLDLDQGNNREEFLSAWPEQGWNLQALLQTRVLGVSWRNFALTVEPQLDQSLRLPPDLFRAVFDGVYFDDPVSLSQTRGQVQAVVPVTLAYGQPLELPWLSERVQATYVGGGFKTLLGMACARIDDFEGELLTQADSISVHSDVRLSTAGIPMGEEQSASFGINGWGYAFDLGLAVDLDEQWQCGLALHNLLGGINWSDAGAWAYEQGYEIALSSADINEITGFSEAEMDSAQSAWQVADSSYARDGFRTAYPAYLLLGAHYQWRPALGFDAAYRQELNPVLDTALRPRLAVAARFDYLNWLPLRCGVAVGGLEGFQWSTGFGLAFTHYQLDFGFAQSGGMFNWAKGVTLGLEQRVYF